MSVSIGRAIEELGLDILKGDGYKIIEWTSSKKPLSPYDCVVEKDGVQYYVEIRGRMESKGYFLFTTKKLNRLKACGENVRVLLIYPNGHKFLTLSELESDALVLIGEEARKFQSKQHGTLIRVSERTDYHLVRLRDEMGASGRNGVIQQLIHEHRTIPLLQVVYGTVY